MRSHITKKILILLCLVAFFVNLGCKKESQKFSVTDGNNVENIKDFPALKKLSEYNKFILPLKDMKPDEGVFLYDLNSFLFTDYAFKKRFIYLPKGKVMQYSSENTFDFPEGSMIFKFFYYPSDFSKPKDNLRIIETRILIKSSAAWQALTYIWNEDQTDANLSLAGETKNVKWIDQSNQKHNIKYSVPGILVCKSCHEFNGSIVPIGPAARHLNKSYIHNSGKNQLQLFAENKKIKGLPDLKNIPHIASWEDTATDLNERSRAYLDINCGHCHRKEGPAKNSGLYLLANEENSYKVGIYKPPVAAGRGSGNLRFAIQPGKPAESILVYRMTSLEPGVMMPEAGRRTVHNEGVALVSDWIMSMKQ